MLLHPKQKEIILKGRRFNVIRAGRKGGKTALEVEKMGFKAITDEDNVKGDKVLYIAPTQIQARKIIWEALKGRFGALGRSNEQTLEMSLPTLSEKRRTIYVGGWENRENYRGLTGVKHITFDETDSMKEFQTGWQEIFRPLLLDTGGSADFIGTPKKENPNMKRLEKDFSLKGEDFASFHFTSSDNPYLDPKEIESAKRDMDAITYRQEILAEYVENTGALFKFDATIDVFSNTIIKKPNDKYLIIDVADDGSDKTIFSFWDSLEEYRREEYSQLSTEMIIGKTREYCSLERIPLSHTLVDAIGVGSAVASSSLLQGIVGFKSSFAPIKTDEDITRLPNLGYTGIHMVSDFKNLRSQCGFMLAHKVNNHEVSSKVTGKQKEKIIEELSSYQDASQGDGKRMMTMKEDVKASIGRSPDDSDTWIMRMYFEIKNKASDDSPERAMAIGFQQMQMGQNRFNQGLNSSK